MTELANITSCRTMRALEFIMSHNVSIQYTKKSENKVADYLSRLPQSTTEVPHWAKFPHPKTDPTDLRPVNFLSNNEIINKDTQNPPQVAPTPSLGPILLLYNNQHIDLHLDYIASQAKQDTDYQGLINLIRSKESLADTHKQCPLRQYSKYFKKLSLMDFPSGGLLIYDSSRVFIPKNEISNMVKILHTFHQTVGQMTMTARAYVFWPKIQQQLEEMSNNCVTCITFKKAKDPSVPLTPTASLTKPMDSLVSDWGCKKKMYFLIIADRATGFIWAGQYQSMSTNNTIDLLKKIIIEHGKPLEVTSDNGPAYREKFSRFCRDNFIFHRLSAAYLPAHNGAAEISIRKIKLLIKQNPLNSGATLQALVATANHRQSSITGAGSAYSRLTGLKPRLGLPALPEAVNKVEKGKLQEKLNSYRDKVAGKVNRSTHQRFQIGDMVYIFNSGTKMFDQKGSIISYIPNENGLPTSFMVKMQNNHTRSVNQSWLHPVEAQ